jgi:hypothetical protein
MVCADPSRVIAKQTVDLLHWHMHHHTGEVTERAQWAWRDAVATHRRDVTRNPWGVGPNIPTVAGRAAAGLFHMFL